MKCKSCTYKEMKKAGEKGDHKLHEMAEDSKHKSKKTKIKAKIKIMIKEVKKKK